MTIEFDNDMPEWTETPNGTIIDAAFVRNARLSPDGTLYHVNDYQHHKTACIILGEDMVLADDALTNMGYIRIGVTVTSYISRDIPREKVTQAQFDTLWDMFVDAHSRRDILLGWQKHAYDVLADMVSTLHN